MNEAIKKQGENKKILVIVPTYNEAYNIKKLIPEILKQHTGIEILVIDDNSSDGTASVVMEMMKINNSIHIIERPSKMGLGTAYVEGFRFALKHSYDFIFEMDADFSHNPRTIPEFLTAIEKNDLVIGSRYVRGVNVINWPLSRLFLSWFANLYTRIITGLPVKDSTSGFKCFRRRVLEAINLDAIHSDGYSFQIEMHFKTWKKGFKIMEIPIVFTDRYHGESKMSSGVIREAIFMVWKLRFLSIMGKLD
ncbi:MAG: polyprenol monophosphomannose synthase [bacterium]